MPLLPDELAALTDAALSTAPGGGCRNAELRVERIRSQDVHLHDGAPEGSSDTTEFGMGVRVVVDEAVGVAATVDVRPEEAATLVRLAIETARVTSLAGGGPRMELAPEPSHGEVEWAQRLRGRPGHRAPGREGGAARELEPAPARLRSRRLPCQASVLSVSEETYLADLNGTRATQHRVRLHPQLEALALDGGGFETMRTLAPPVGRGWEYLTDGPDSTAGTGRPNWPAMPTLLAEKLAAPSVEAGTYDLVVDPSNLWLTIHESIGHATELDRAVGYEAAYAGTSFATFDQLDVLRYGSSVMHVTGDRTVEHGLATVAIDSEGVAAQSFDLIRDGTLVGYQLDRSIAAIPWGSSARTDAPSPTRPSMCRFSAWPTCRWPPPPNIEPRTAPARPISSPASNAASTSWATRAGPSICSATTSNSPASVSSPLSAGSWRGRCTMWRIKRPPLISGAPWRLWAALYVRVGWGLQLRQGPTGPGGAGESHGCPSVLVRGVRVLNAREEAGR